MRIYLALLLLSFISIANCVDKTDTLDDITIKVLGKSGKIQVIKTDKDQKALKTVTIDMSSIQEKNSKGEIVGKKGSAKHSFNNFAQLDFSFSTIQEGKFQGIGCRYFTFESSKIAGQNDKLLTTVYIFTEDGTINTGIDQQVDVKKGTVKFSVEIDNWPFCTEKDCVGERCCKEGDVNEQGEFLDFSINIKSDTDPEYLKTGAQGAITLANDFKKDGNWVKMEDKYPLIEGNSYTFRFGRFDEKVIYDPVIELNSNSNLINMSLLILFLFVSTLFF